MAHVKQRKHAVKRTKLATGVGVGTALLAGMMATTATAAEGNTINLSEVSVNADKQAPVVGDYHSSHLESSRFTQPIADTPQTVQVISKDLIEDQHATTLTEALRNSAGVGTFNLGENGATNTGDTVYMRGFDASGSIYVDGVRNTGSISRDTFNTEQIEVIKGPNGTNYGRTTPGGSINMVTKRARKGDFGSINASVGTDSQKRTTFDINQQVSDTTAVRLNAMWQDSGVPGRDKVEDKRWGIAPAVSFGLGTDTRLHINLLHTEQNNVPDGGVVTVGLPGYSSPDSSAFPQLDGAPKVDSENFYGTSDDYDDVTVDMATIIFEQDIDANKTFYNTTRWSRIHQDYLITAFMASAGQLTGAGHNASTPLNALTMPRLDNTKDQTNKVISNQSGIVQTINGENVDHTLSYGIEFSREKIEQRDTKALPGLANVNMYNPVHEGGYDVVGTGAGGEGELRTAAIYLFDTIEFGEAFQLTAGVRLDHYSLDYENTGVCGGRGPDCGSNPNGTVVPDINASVSENLFSWQVGGLYHITENGNVYVDYAVASQPPGGASLEFSSRESSAANAIYDPQEFASAEVGTKWQLADNRLLLTAAFYRTTLTNQVEGSRADGYAQIGERRIQGVELTATGQISRNWNVSAGFTTLDSEITKGNSDTNDKDDKTFAYTPDYAFTSWTTYRLPFGLVIGGGARYTDGLTRGADGAAGTPEHTDGYWVVDAMASYPVTKQLSVQLNVYNVTDEEYVAAINKSGYRYTPGEPRSAILSVNYSF